MTKLTLTENEKLISFLIQALKDRAEITHTQLTQADKFFRLDAKMLAATLHVLQLQRRYLTLLENLLKKSNAAISPDLFLR